MKTSTLAFGATALLAALAAPAPAAAQAIPGVYTLPKGDFMWRWGNERHEREVGDFEARGSDGGFLCELRGEVSPTSTLDPSEVRELENSLQGRIDFVYTVSMLMQDMENRRELDWAVLTCEKGTNTTQSTPEEKAENEARAREKMQREVERRRERAARDAND